MAALFPDVGAAIGTYAIGVGRKYRDDARVRVVAIEGNGETAELLEANVSLNACAWRIEVLRAILWDREGVAVHLNVDATVPTSGRYSRPEPGRARW